VATKKRIEIKVEIHEVLRVHRRSVSIGFCRQCGQQVEMLRLKKLDGSSRDALDQSGFNLNADNAHATELEDGSLLICLKSLEK
jgi:hypothetical protein